MPKNLNSYCLLFLYSILVYFLNFRYDINTKRLKFWVNLSFFENFFLKLYCLLKTMKKNLMLMLFLYLCSMTICLSPSDPWIGGLPWNSGSVPPITVPDENETVFLQILKNESFLRRKEMKLNVLRHETNR
jgi:hypothetical protein